MDYGITYSVEPLILECYFDASRITNEKDNSSTCGWTIVYRRGDILCPYSLKKQMCIADSTMST